MASKKTSHNALSQKTGDVYHYYVAILYMFQIPNWTECTIEESGDIAFFNSENKQIQNIEVKHHLSSKELKIYNEEFQKTLYNWFNIREQFDDDTTLILHTTSSISDENILRHWNEFDVEKRYKEVENHSKKSDTNYYANCKKYFLEISKDIKALKSILDKVVINESSLDIDNIKSEIMKNSFFNIFTKNEHKFKVIESLYGLIGSRLKSEKSWSIAKEEFEQKLKELSTLAQEKILRTDNDIKIKKESISEYTEKQFIRKLENIEFKDDVKETAINDYAKTIIEVANRSGLTKSVEYHFRLKNYEVALINRVKEIHTEYTYKDGNDIRKSQQSYFEIMKLSRIPFMPEEFDDQTTFFQKGYFHVLADDKEEPKQICWSLKPEDRL